MCSVRQIEERKMQTFCPEFKVKEEVVLRMFTYSEGAGDEDGFEEVMSKKAKKKAAAAAAVSGTTSDVEVRKICGAARERKRSDVKKRIYHTVGAVTAFPLAVWGIAEAASTCCSRTRAASNFNCSSPLQSTAKLLCMRYGMKINIMLCN